jgi:drug/metabolite transporter (DMT)-like permease
MSANKSFLVYISFATVYLVWGSTYFFILLSLGSFSPMLLGAFRFLIAGAIMLLISLFRGDRIFDLRTILNASVSGILMLFVGTGVVIYVERELPSAFVAILVSAAPFWFVLLDKRMWKENLTNKFVVTGLIIGFIGIVLLFADKVSNMFSGADRAGIGPMLLILVGSLCWTIGSIFSKYKTSTASNTVNVGWQMFAAGIVFLLFALFNDEIFVFNWSKVTPTAWLSIWYLILFGSIAAYTAYVWLLQVRPSSQVSTYAYVNPVVAVLLGVFFANEKISTLQIVGLGVILTSVLLLNLAKYRSDVRGRRTEDRMENVEAGTLKK